MSQAQFIRYLGMAKGSAGELRSQAFVASDLHYISVDEFNRLADLADKNARQLARFITYLKSNPQSLQLHEEQAEYLV